MWKHKINHKLYPLLGILILTVSLPIMVVMARTGFKYITGAQTQNVQFLFSPTTATISSMTSFKLLANSQTYKVGFVDVTVNFDRTKINLDSEVSTTSKLATVIVKTSRSEANSTGKIRLVLGLRPEDKAVPPTGLFELGQLNFRKIGSGTTTLGFVTGDIQVINSTGQKLTTEVVNASITLAGTPAPTPTGTQSPTTSPTNPPVISGNLLKNSSFETDPSVDYYSLTDGSAQLFQSNAYHSGSKSLKIVSTVDDTNLHRWLSKNGSIAVQPGVTYEGRVWVRAQDISNGAMLTINFWGPGTTDYISGATSSKISGSSTDLSWKELTVRATAPSNAKYGRFEMRLVGSGTVYFDDGVFQAVSVSSSTPSPTLAPTSAPTVSPIVNLLKNSGFESDPNSNYATHGTASYSHATDQTHGGSRSLKIISTQTSSSALARWYSINGQIPAVPGRTYEAKVWVKTDNVPVGSYLTLNFWGPGIYDHISGSDSVKLTGTKGWTQLVVTSTAPSSAKYLRLEMRINGSGTVWFDDAQLIQK